jgi:hypothetical protein
MPTLEQKYNNTRVLMGIISFFLLALMVGQVIIYPLVLNYNYTAIHTNIYTFIITFTILVLGVCIYMCIRVIRDTYDEFIF